MKKIGFIGLGIMGSHMASHLLKKYNQINLIQRKSQRTKKFISRYKNNLVIYDDLKEFAKNSEVVISCVGNDKDLINIYLKKNTILDNIRKNSIIIDHTTSSSEIAIKLHDNFKKKKAYFFDAPVSGGEIGAKDGTLSIMVGGNKNKFNILCNLLDCYYKSLIYMGNSGNGQLTKMVNQICVASVIQGLAEGLNFAKKKKIKCKKSYRSNKKWSSSIMAA